MEDEELKSVINNFKLIIIPSVLIKVLGGYDVAGLDNFFCRLMAYGRLIICKQKKI
jgi:hypothetical protein